MIDYIDDKKYKYFLIDSLYKSSNFACGRKFKAFFRDFSKEVFNRNIAMLEGIGEFPFVYNENNLYSSIAASLHSLSPYIFSERAMYCKDSKKPIIDSYGNTKNTRFVDFWYMSEDKSFEMWLEVKRIHFGIGKNAKWELVSYVKDNVKDGVRQIINIHDFKPYMFAKEGYFKVALFITPLCSPLSQKAESSLIDSAPLVLNELLGSFIDKRRNMGLLSAYIDLRESIAEGGFYEGEYLPFIALNAIILG